MYPIKFEPLYYEKVWGGRAIGDYRQDMPEGEIGESWDLACHNNGMSIVAEGKFKGQSLQDLIDTYGEQLVGTEISLERFPLLIKMLHAEDKISIQVHPGDEYALKNENDLGKTEVWYVLDAQPDASMVLGVKGCTKEQFEEASKSGNLEPYLNRIPVKKGEIYFIEAGLVHAMEGVLVVEIQQNSDVTYRVYDYGRPRQLHIKQVLDVMNMDLKEEKLKGLLVENEAYNKTYCCFDKNFSLERYDVKGDLKEESDPERFYIFYCVEGNGKIVSNDYEQEIKVGDAILIPAALGAYKISGNLSILKTYVPDIEQLTQEIISVVKY